MYLYNVAISFNLSKLLKLKCGSECSAVVYLPGRKHSFVWPYISVWSVVLFSEHINKMSLH